MQDNEQKIQELKELRQEYRKELEEVERQQSSAIKAFLESVRKRSIAKIRASLGLTGDLQE